MNFYFREFKKHLEDKVLEALQQGSRISQMIREIESAWGIDDQTYDDFELLNLRFSKLLDAIHAYEISNPIEQGQREEMVD